MPPRTMPSLHRLPAAICACTVAFGLLTSCAPEPHETPTSTAPTAPAPSPQADTPTTESPFDRTTHSIDAPDSPWVIVNKLRPLTPQDYVPTDLVAPQVSNTNGQPLRKEAALATERLIAAAASDDVKIRLVSAYRGYDMQVDIYGSFVATQGRAYADTTSARPGFSEHQTGLAADFGGEDDCTIDTCFAETPAGKWLREHSSEYGFTLRYPEGLEHITGYEFEPWHYRFVGAELATELRTQGIATLEEFFDLPHAGDYAN